MKSNGVTVVPGVKVGHYTDRDAATGCTVVLCEGGAVGGVDVRGSAPGTRETNLLRPTTLVPKVHAILLTGGSAFGLDAASGVMRWLEEHRIGIRFGGTRIPIVPAAVLFDLGLVTDKTRPGPEEGYAACQSASSGSVAEGSVGAGTGATVASLLGPKRSVKGGIGTWSLDLGQGLFVGAIVAVNAMGGIFDPDTGELLAGPRGDDDSTMCNPLETISSKDFGIASGPPPLQHDHRRGCHQRASEQGSGKQDGLCRPRWRCHRGETGPPDGRWRHDVCAGNGNGGPRMGRESPACGRRCMRGPGHRQRRCESGRRRRRTQYKGVGPT